MRDVGHYGLAVYWATRDHSMLTDTCRTRALLPAAKVEAPTSEISPVGHTPRCEARVN